MSRNLPRTLITCLTIGFVILFLFGIWGVFSSFEISSEFCSASPVNCGFGDWFFGAEIVAIASIGILVSGVSGMKWFGMFGRPKDVETLYA
jgi:hypothetical protein